MPTWRAARPDDVPAIAAISKIVLSDYPEDADVFEELIGLAPDGCHVLEDGATMVGYVVGHPWVRFSPPPLNTPLGRLPDMPDCWYIHDLSLLEEARGRGAASQGIALSAAACQARHLPLLSIVAVNGAAGFWVKQGFSDAGGAAMMERIASYGSDARYMERLP